MPTVTRLVELPKTFVPRNAVPGYTSKYAHRVRLESNEELFEVDPSAISEADYATLLDKNRTVNTRLPAGHYTSTEGKRFYIAGSREDLTGRGSTFPILNLYVDFNHGGHLTNYFINGKEVYRYVSDKHVSVDEGLSRAFLEVRQALVGAEES